MQALKKPEPVVRRSVTMPDRASESMTSRRSSVAPSPDPQIETLYKHPSVRIMSFMATAVPTSRHYTNPNPSLDEEAGTLSWTSPLERLMAVGMKFTLLFEILIFYFKLIYRLFRPIKYIQSSRVGCLPQLWDGYASYTSEIAMLVRGRFV
jgi:hypothetical protein